MLGENIYLLKCFISAILHVKISVLFISQLSDKNKSLIKTDKNKSPISYVKITDYKYFNISIIFQYWNNSLE